MRSAALAKDPNGMDVSSSHIAIGSFEPSDRPDEDVNVMMEDTPPAAEVSQQFFDAKSNLDDIASRSDGSASPFAPKASDSPRRPSDVGSIPLKPLVSLWMDGPTQWILDCSECLCSRV